MPERAPERRAGREILDVTEPCAKIGRLAMTVDRIVLN